MLIMPFTSNFLISNGAGSSSGLSTHLSCNRAAGLTDIYFLSYIIVFSSSLRRGFGYELTESTLNDEAFLRFSEAR